MPAPITEHNFSLLLSAPPTDPELDLLYEAGCGDALVSTQDGRATAEFDRPADRFDRAVLSAIAAVESVGRLRVLRVVPDELVTMAEIARRLGRSTESVRLLAQGRRRAGSGFPAPAVAPTARSRLWRWADIAAWSGDATHRDRAVFLAAVNAALELRQLKPELGASRRDVMRLLDDAA